MVSHVINCELHCKIALLSKPPPPPVLAFTFLVKYKNDFPVVSPNITATVLQAARSMLVSLRVTGFSGLKYGNPKMTFNTNSLLFQMLKGAPPPPPDRGAFLPWEKGLANMSLEVIAFLV